MDLRGPRNLYRTAAVLATSLSIIGVAVLLTPLEGPAVLVAAMLFLLPGLLALDPSDSVPLIFQLPLLAAVVAGFVGLSGGPFGALGLGVAFGLLGIELAFLAEGNRRRHIGEFVECRDCGNPIPMLSFRPYFQAFLLRCPDCKRRLKGPEVRKDQQ